MTRTPRRDWTHPDTPRGDDADTLFGVRVADPYRWLEDAKDPNVQRWMRAQDELARRHLASLPGRDAVAARLKELCYAEDVSPPVHEGDRWFISRRAKGREKASVFTRETEDGPETLLFDPEAMSPDGSISLQGYWPSWKARHVAYKISRNNADTSEIRVRDLATGQDLPDVIPGARYAAPSWSPDDQGFYYNWTPSDGSVAPAEIPGRQELRYHRLGADPATDAVIVPSQGNPQLFLGAEVTRDGHWLLLSAWHGWNSSETWLKDLRQPPGPGPGDSPFARAGFSPLARGEGAQYVVTEHEDRFFIHANENAPRGRVFVAEPGRLEREQWKEIIAEPADAIIESVRIVGGMLAVQYQKDVHAVMELRHLDGSLAREIALPGVGASSGLVGRADEDVAYYEFNSFVEPGRIFRMSVTTGATTLWDATDLPLDPSTMEVEQVFYSSKDGTRIPMFLVHAKGWRRDGNHPVLLTGYGGFNSGNLPSFRPHVVPWLEHGGVFAVANIRGGNEYGEDWHRAGMLSAKQNVFDDFIGAAEWLIREGITSPERLAIAGASNGGLLVGAAMVQRPELFGAVVCAVPLLDMVRFTAFGSGATWAGEYGDPADADAFKWLHAYSPYHHVSKGARYPALLMLSADSDDRVDPMHARKFVAAIQHAAPSDRPALLRIEANAGHVGADQVKIWVAHVADEQAFLHAELGME